MRLWVLKIGGPTFIGTGPENGNVQMWYVDMCYVMSNVACMSLMHPKRGPSFTLTSKERAVLNGASDHKIIDIVELSSP